MKIVAYLFAYTLLMKLIGSVAILTGGVEYIPAIAVATAGLVAGIAAMNRL